MKKNSFYTIFFSIFMVFSNIPQKNGWSTHPMAHEEQEGDQKKEAVNFSASLEANILVDRWHNSGYSGPQMRIAAEEIDFLFKNSKDLVCVMEFGGCFKRLSHAWMELLGWDIHELLKRPYITWQTH